MSACVYSPHLPERKGYKSVCPFVMRCNHFCIWIQCLVTGWDEYKNVVPPCYKVQPCLQWIQPTVMVNMNNSSSIFYLFVSLYICFVSHYDIWGSFKKCYCCPWICSFAFVTSHTHFLITVIPQHLSSICILSHLFSPCPCLWTCCLGIPVVVSILLCVWRSGCHFILYVGVW